MYTIPESEIFESMKVVNPWWETNSIDKKLKEKTPRKYLESFYKEIIYKKLRRTALLLGPRRVGKTVLMYHAIEELMQKGVSPKKILYISIDNPVFINIRLEKLVTIFTNNFQHKLSDGLYIFFDEIQYLKGWEQHLKSLYDSYLNFQFVASGSAASVLQKKSSQSVGRFADFILPPMTFAEFLVFKYKGKEEEFKKLQKNYLKKMEINVRIEKVESKNNGIKDKKNIKELNKLFLEYINYGGFPDVMFLSNKQRLEKRSRISNDIIEKVLSGDLPSLYNVDPREVNRFFKMIAYNAGKEFSLDRLAKESGLSKPVISKYIEYLESAFLIKKISKIDQNLKKFKRETQFKLYLLNPSMRTFLFGELKEDDCDLAGLLVENAIFAQMIYNEDVSNRMYYARWNSGEVDLIVLNELSQQPEYICEIKWSDAPDLKSLKTFIKDSGYYKKITNNYESFPVVSTKTNVGVDFYEHLRFIPSAILCLMKSLEC